MHPGEAEAIGPHATDELDDCVDEDAFSSDREEADEE